MKNACIFFLIFVCAACKKEGATQFPEKTQGVWARTSSGEGRYLSIEQNSISINTSARVVYYKLISFTEINSSDGTEYKFTLQKTRKINRIWSMTLVNDSTLKVSSSNYLKRVE